MTDRLFDQYRATSNIMSRASYAESHATDTVMSRAESRTGSISTLWSSAEVPFCLDPRTRPSLDDFDLILGRSHSTMTPTSPPSRSNRISMDFARLSVDIPDHYPRRLDNLGLTPPRASESASSSGTSPSRAPSYSIGTIQEDQAVPSTSHFSHHPYMPPSLGAQHRVLSSRFSDDTVDEPHFLHSASQGTFGSGSLPQRKLSTMSSVSGAESSRASSIQGTEIFQKARPHADGQASLELYRRAHLFFDKEYSVQRSLDSKPQPSLDQAASGAFDGTNRFERHNLTGSSLSHEGSVPSCSRSQSSTQASTSDASSAFSAEGHAEPPFVLVEPFGLGSALSTITSGYGHTAFVKKDDTLSVPSLPSFPSSDSTLTATHFSKQREVRRRPSTADVYSRTSSIPQQAAAPISPGFVRSQVHAAGATQPTSRSTPTASPDEAATSAKGRTASKLLRGRVASTPKLRLEANSLFPSEQALYLRHPVPPVPERFNDKATDRRPSTAQVDGRVPFFGRRLRSRTLGESDQVEVANMQTAVVNASRDAPLPVSPLRPLILSSLSTTRAIPIPSYRKASHVSATSLELPTPNASICSVGSPATTNSSLPVTPRTTTVFPRPKSRGNSAVGKSGGAGWASYLNAGLTLHLEGDHGRACQINMAYLAYDPFGRPEQLVEDDAGRVLTPKRPKSRGDKDQEAEQSGTLEFGPLDEMFNDACTFDASRKSEGSVLLKRLTVGEDTKADLLTRQAALSLKTLGNHRVSGFERQGSLAWKFVYRVEVDRSHPEKRRLVPLRFSCSATLLNPERAKKSRLINLVKKQMVSTLASKAEGANESNHSAMKTASPASSHRSYKQIPAAAREAQADFSSPAQRCTGLSSAASGGSTHRSPLRKTTRNNVSAISVASAESSFCSQSRTPIKDAVSGDSTITKNVLQASPVSAQFGRPTLVRQQPFTPTINALQTALGQANMVGQKLHGKVSMTSIGSSSHSSGSVQMAKPIIINGRKLIPISLPAGLARKNRIDPSLLQANVVPNLANSGPKESQPSDSLHSSAKSSQQKIRSTAKRETTSSRGFLADQPRSGPAAGGSSRPPTASETIKLEYLARTAADTHDAAIHLRHQKSFTGALLTPASFADEDRQARRQRSKTNEDGYRRPFTADAWGQSQYPTREQQMRAISQQHRPLGPFDNTFDERQEQAIQPLPILPRANSRPRTAQTITTTTVEGSRFHIPLRAV